MILSWDALWPLTFISTVEGELLQEQAELAIYSSAKASDCVLVNLSVRRRMGKNWLRSAMAKLADN